MIYGLPPDVDEQIKQRLASGRYASEIEVLREAMEALKLSDELAHFQATIAESREQAARGDKGSLNVASVMQNVQRRLSESE